MYAYIGAVCPLSLSLSHGKWEEGAEHLHQVGRISPGRGTTIPFPKVCDTGAPNAERVIYSKCMYTG